MNDEKTTSLELHGAKTGNCLRAAVGLAEAGIQFTIRHVDLARGEHHNATYRALNPACQVPILVSRTSTGSPDFVLTQSSAILFYADQLSPGRLLPTQAGLERAKALEAFFYFTGDVIAANGAAFRLRSRFPDAAAALSARSLEAIAASERFLSSSGYMGGEHFSIADIAAVTIVTAVNGELPWANLPQLAAWHDRISHRPAVQAGMAAFDPR